MDIILGVLIVSTIITFFIQPISLIKILSIQNQPLWKKILTPIPLLQFSPISSIMKISIWKLIGVILLIAIVFTISAIILENNALPIAGFLLRLIGAFSIRYYIFSTIAKEGNFADHQLLGLAASLPISEIFTIPYIAWKGRWT